MIRSARAGDLAAILRLNKASEHYLSPLDDAALERLHEAAAYHRVYVEDRVVVAFLLALREGASYASENYRWFSAHRERFLYIDRIAVAHAHRRSGIGKWLYQDLITFARGAELPTITCEYDLDPPNPASAAFHARFGFREVARQTIRGGRKTVSLQELELGPVTALKAF